jgi:hypothetical protein
MPTKLRRALPHGVMLLASVLLYWAASRIDVDSGGRIGPDVWPKTIIVIMGLLCAYEVLKRLVAKAPVSAEGLIGELQRNPQGGPGDGAEPPVATHPRMLAGGIAIIAAYVLLVPWTGFFATTAVFLSLFPWVGGLRKPVVSAVLGIGGSLLLVVVFMRVAYISLPLGEGPFRALSLALMRAIGVT